MRNLCVVGSTGKLLLWFGVGGASIGGFVYKHVCSFLFV